MLDCSNAAAAVSLAQWPGAGDWYLPICSAAAAAVSPFFGLKMETGIYLFVLLLQLLYLLLSGLKLELVFTCLFCCCSCCTSCSLVWSLN